MTTFIISILAFLLTIFPSCGMLLAPYQSLTFPGEKAITEEIMAAIEAKNIAAIEDMMSLKIKRNVNDLPGKIDKLIEAIDGKIIVYSRSGGGGNDVKDYGTRISRTSWSITIETANESYWLSMSWVVVNNRAPEEVGMSGVSLLDSEGNELAAIFVP
jgi:hypothetical protein